MLASAPLLQTAWGLSEQQVDSEIERKLQASAPSFQRPLDFVAFLNRRAATVRNLPLKNVGESRLEVLSVEKYPVEKIKMDGVLLENLSEDFTPRQPSLLLPPLGGVPIMTRKGGEGGQAVVAPRAVIVPAL